MKKINIIGVTIIFFFIGLLVPRPSLRIEMIGHIHNETKNILLGSSIIDHVGEGEDSITLRSIAQKKDWSVLAKAGLTPEEIDFLLAKSQYASATSVLGLYALLAPETYNKAKYLYYKNEFRDAELIERKLWSNSYKEKNEEKYFKIKKQIATKASKGNKYEFDKIDFEHSKYTYWGQIQITRELIDRNLERVVSKKRNLILIAPTETMVGYEADVYIQQMIELVEESKYSSQVKIIRLSENYLSEPWCMCGHLNQEGVQLVSSLIWK
jgi:hypothetical protein